MTDATTKNLALAAVLALVSLALILAACGLDVGHAVSRW